MCIRIYMFCLKNTHKHKAKKTRQENRKTKTNQRKAERKCYCCEHDLWKI